MYMHDCRSRIHALLLQLPPRRPAKRALPDAALLIVCYGCSAMTHSTAGASRAPGCWFVAAFALMAVWAYCRGACTLHWQQAQASSNSTFPASRHLRVHREGAITPAAGAGAGGGAGPPDEVVARYFTLLVAHATELVEQVGLS